MHYTQPKITGTFPAVSTILSDKFSMTQEVASNLPSTGNAYQADE